MKSGDKMEIYADDEDLFEEEKLRTVSNNIERKNTTVLLSKFSFDIDSSLKIMLPDDTNYSILDEELSTLLEYDIDELKNILKKELCDAKKLDNVKKKKQLQKIFIKLLYLQPSDVYPNFDESELRFYIDLISMPEIYQDEEIRKFLKNDFYVIDDRYNEIKQKEFLLKLYDYYDNHSVDVVNKLNYILRGSNDIVDTFVCNGLDLEFFFSERVISLFDKEDLSQMYRFFLNDYLRRETLVKILKEDSDKVLFMISIMAKKVKLTTGHNSEFIEICMSLFEVEKEEVENFINVLNDFYDCFVVDINNEKDFEKLVLNNDVFLEIRELINFISYNYNDSSNMYLTFHNVDSLISLLSSVNNRREMFHCSIFKPDVILKIKKGKDYSDNIFRDINSRERLRFFKEAFVFNVYGIGLHDLEYFISSYGKYVDEYEICIKEDDRDVLEVLKSLKNIYDLDIEDPNFKDKLKVMQMAYLDFVNKNGFNCSNVIASPLIVEGFLNKMVINTYNEKTFKIDSSSKILKIDDGVKVIDSGFKFDIVLTSLYGVRNFYDKDFNMSSKWNTAYHSNIQGISAMHISNENLGVIRLRAPFLGFSYIPEEALNAMGPCDIFSSLSDYSLRSYNKDIVKNIFIPVSVMSDETRYGYNELVLDRFMMRDNANKIKLQPDYVVCFKIGEKDYDDINYSEALKVAKDFDIPIVLIDIEEIKKNEQLEIAKMEEELFSSDEFKPDLLKDIVMRYMNNYTGSLTISGTYESRYRDFSVSGMEDFFDTVFDYLDGMNDKDLRKSWIDTLVDIYYVEREKFDYVNINIDQYNHSVTKFILDENGVGETIWSLVSGNEFFVSRKKLSYFDDDYNYSGDDVVLDPDDEDKSNDTSNINNFVSENNYCSVNKVIVDFINEVGIGSKFKLESNVEVNSEKGYFIDFDITNDSELLLVENLVISYFLEYFDGLALIELKTFGFERQIDYEVSDNFDFAYGIEDSPYNKVFKMDKNKVELLKSDKLNNYVDIVSKMDDKRFVEIFRPIILDYSIDTSCSFEEIALRFLSKKDNIKKNFSKLSDSYNEGSTSINSDKKK